MGRAKAYNKSGKYMEALADAQYAAEVDSKCAAAYHEQGRALFELEEFESAKEAFETASSLEPDRALHKIWINQCRASIGEDLKSEAGIISSKGFSQKTDTIDASDVGAKEQAQNPVSVSIDDPEYSKYWKAPVKLGSSPLEPTANASDSTIAANKYRYQWFQSANKIEVAILAKKLVEEQVEITFDVKGLQVKVWPRSLETGKISKGTPDYDLKIDLAEEIIPEESSFEILTTKIEIKLAKAVQGNTWASLEKLPGRENFENENEGQQNVSLSQLNLETKSPTYPYAGKKVDWDKIARQEEENEDKDQVSKDKLHHIATDLYT